LRWRRQGEGQRRRRNRADRDAKRLRGEFGSLPISHRESQFWLPARTAPRVIRGIHCLDPQRPLQSIGPAAEGTQVQILLRSGISGQGSENVIPIADLE
jgi:hypothetical protein